MIEVSCDKCGFKMGTQPSRPLYAVKFDSMLMTSKNNVQLFIDDSPIGYESHDQCLCGRCLTKFYRHVAEFFVRDMEDTQKP